MQQYRDLQGKAFLEVKNILDDLSKCENAEELLLKKDVFPKLSEWLSFLKILSENESFLVSNNHTNHIENQTVSSENIPPEILVSEDFSHATELEVNEEKIPEFAGAEEISYTEIPDSEEPVYNIATEQVQQETLVEFHEQPTLTAADDFGEESQHSTFEKKFKIAPIKGLKPAAEFSVEPPQQESYHENQPKSFKNFRLDLNDRIAFSNSLFGGNMQELDDVTEKLNEFDNLEDAKQYLSDIYYQKDWGRVDDFAQRLWILVENKFL